MTYWESIPPRSWKNYSAKSLLCAQKKIHTKRYSKRDYDTSVPVLIFYYALILHIFILFALFFLYNAIKYHHLNALTLSVQNIANVRAQLTQAMNKIGPLQRHNARITRENTKLHRDIITMREQTATDAR